MTIESLKEYVDCGREIEYLFDMDVNVCSAHLIDVNEWVIVNEKSTYKNNVPMRRSVE